MNHFTQHIPGFVDTDDAPVEFDFKDENELFANPFFDSYKQDDFEKFEYECNQQIIVAVYDHGYRWWVVGYTSKPLVGMDTWKPQYRQPIGQST